jgi:hypothetical protein
MNDFKLALNVAFDKTEKGKAIVKEDKARCRATIVLCCRAAGFDNKDVPHIAKIVCDFAYPPPPPLPADPTISVFLHNYNFTKIASGMAGLRYMS